MRALAERVGATAPASAWVPWFAVAAALLAWYPVEFTGEWVEWLAGALFLVSAPVVAGPFWLGAGAAMVSAALLARVSERRWIEAPHLVACATAEIAALARELEAGNIARSRLRRAGSVHKRIYAAGREGYLDLDAISLLGTVQSTGADSASGAARRRYLVDPWGTAYWIDAERPGDGQRRVVVYSFGPNRRRNGNSGDIGPARDDDLTAVAIVPDR